MTHENKGSVSLALLIILMLTVSMIAGTIYNPLERNALPKFRVPPSWGGVIVWYDNIPFDPSVYTSPHPRILIVDPDNGPFGRSWKRDEIEYLKSAGTIVLAYLNIGFAEEWRDYWNKSWTKYDHPEWLTWVQYPGWEGEYFVKYWHPSAWSSGGWVDILYHEINKIIRKGFDGVLLDNIDVYTAWTNPASWGLGDELPQVENATTWITYLVGNISSYAKSLDRDFKVYVNIGTGLPLLNTSALPLYIDGVLREEVWYSGGSPVDTIDTMNTLKYLVFAHRLGLDVIVLDYTSDVKAAKQVMEKARQYLFYAQVSQDYGLDSLPAYIPSSTNIEGTTIPETIIAWNYHGEACPGYTCGFDIYLAKINPLNGTIVSKKTISYPGNDIYPSIAGSNDTVLLVWQRSNDTLFGYDTSWSLSILLLDPETLTPRQKLFINSINSGLYYPRAIYYDGSFHILFYNYTYTDDTLELREVIVDPSTGNIEDNNTLWSIQGVERFYPIQVTVTDNGYGLLWSVNGYLFFMFRNQTFTKTWLIDEDIWSGRYLVAGLSRDEFLIMYSSRGNLSAKVLLLNGTISELETIGLPIPTWYTHVAVSNGLVSYTGCRGEIIIAKLHGNHIELVKKEPIPKKAFRISPVLFYNNRTLIASGLYLNNTLFMKTIPS